MGETPRFQYEDQYGDTVTTTVEDCVTIAEALLIYAGIKSEIISEEFGVEVLFARASPQPEYQNYFCKKTEELKILLPHAKQNEINLLTSILINTVLLKYKAHLLFIEDQESISISTAVLVDVFIEMDDKLYNEEEDEFSEPEKIQHEEPREIGWSIHPPKRIQGYALSLIRALQHFNQVGLDTRPTARNVLEYFRESVRREPNSWPEIAQVHVHELAFYDSRGNVATADLEALRKAIDRYTRLTERP